MLHCGRRWSASVRTLLSSRFRSPLMLLPFSMLQVAFPAMPARFVAACCGDCCAARWSADVDDAPLCAGTCTAVQFVVMKNALVLVAAVTLYWYEFHSRCQCPLCSCHAHTGSTLLTSVITPVAGSLASWY